jgi:L-cysteine:1D-myo-inositol 2-amino-2-deoxy-alpha-D-glucopyranoside ligase
VQGALEDLPISLDEALTIFAARGGDPDRAGKRHPLDTLLWSAERPGEPSWSSAFGTGRPGWHIECVAIALSTLTGQSWNDPKNGTSISLQGGGSDLRFPHHYMTNVQARAITGKDFATIYLHTGMIFWQGEKMSKSLGNLVFVSKLREAGWSGNEIRLALINRDYRADLNWEMRLLEDARSSLERIRSALSREEVAPTHEVVLKIRESLSNDLDVKSFGSVSRYCPLNPRVATKKSFHFASD